MTDDQRCLLYFNLPFNDIIKKDIVPKKVQPKNPPDDIPSHKNEKENKKGFIPKKD